MTPGRALKPRGSRAWKTPLALGLIVAAGALVRVAGLGSWTGGLWHDEALNGLLARSVLGGERPIFFYPEPRNPLEPLFPYWNAGVLGLLRGGAPDIGALRLGSALLGTLTLLAFWPLARRALPRRWALAAVLALALLPWHVHFSRLAFRTILAPLFACLAGWSVLAWLESGRPKRAALAGLVAGLALYAYLSAWSLPVAMALALGFGWRWGRGTFRSRGGPEALPKAWAGAAAGLLAMALALGPFARHCWDSGGKPFRRAGTVALPLAEVPRNAARAAGLFFAAGDPIFRHGPPGRPLFPPVEALVFALGVWTLARNARARRGAGFYVLIAAAGFVAASAMSRDAPHKLRALGAAPLVALALVQGARALSATFRRRFSRRLGRRRARWIARAALALLFARYLWAEAEAFRGWRDDPRHWFEFSGTTTSCALWVRGASPEEAGRFGARFGHVRDGSVPVFAPRATVFDDPSFRWLAEGAPNVFPVESLEGALVAGPREPSEALLIVTTASPDNPGAVARLAPGAKVAAAFANPRTGEVWARALLIRRKPEPFSAAEREAAARFSPRL